MKVAIVGAGGVGGYLAFKLAESGVDPYLVARSAHGRAIAEKGLVLRTKEGRKRVALSHVADTPFDETMDAVLFCVKGYDLQAAAEAARPMIGPETLLLPLGNGVGNADVLKRLYPKSPVANGAVYIVSHIEAPGVVALGGKGAYVVMGMEEAETPQTLETLAQTLQKAGVKAKVADDIRTEVWRKYLLISVMATLTSCHDAPMGAILADHRDEMEGALAEVAAVGRAEGAKLGQEEIDNVFRQIEKLPYDAPTSMWLDFRAHRPTELETLTGYVVERAKAHDLEVPVMARCYEALKR
ncbi:ketopantoate reductase family protein [Hydrogenimonas sp.]